MIKKIFILIFLMLLFAFVFGNDDYQIKIELKTKNLSAKYLDEDIAISLKEELLKISKIKDIVSFSHSLGVDLYIKTKDRNNIEIEEKLNSFVFNNNEILNFKIDKNYDLKYDYFLIIHDDNYFKLKPKAELIYTKLLKMRAFSDIKIYGEVQIVDNIYFKYENLLNFNLDLNDIKKIIKKNNLKINEDDSNLRANLNGQIQSIEDLANIEISYKNANFSQKLGDIFELKKEIKVSDNGMIYYSNKPAIVFALSKKNFLLNYFKINSLKQEFSVMLEPINKQEKLEIFLDENDVLKTLEFSKKIKGDNLCFISQNAPNNDKFDINNKNRIIVYSNKKHFSKLKKQLNESNIFFLENPKTYFIAQKNFDEIKSKIKIFNKCVNLATLKFLKPGYDFNFQNMSKFGLKKEDIVNSIFAYNEGLFLDFYKINGEKNEIDLKNSEKSNFVYSKKYNNLFDVNMFLKSNLDEDFNVLARKNFDYLAIIKIKNPSIFRRVKFRYLLSL